jgi:hypothetical protein
VRFPVQDLANRTTNVTAVDLAQKLKTTLYSFTFWVRAVTLNGSLLPDH